MKKQILIAVFTLNFVLLTFLSYSQRVGINSTGASPNTSAFLDVDAAPANDKGLLIPRVSLTDVSVYAPITGAPVTSLLVFNTNAAMTGGGLGYWYWDSAKWVQLGGGGSGGNAWLLLGNAGTVDSVNFLGTTDAVPLNFRVNNQKAGRIDQTGPTFFGYQAGNVNTDPTNTGFGHRALSSNTTGNWNAATGMAALSKNTTGGANTANGYLALANNTIGNNNTATGYYALRANSGTGGNNTATGMAALWQNTTGSKNTATGEATMWNNITGGGNTATGGAALFFNITGDNNTASGVAAGYGAVGVNFNQCTFIGGSSYPTVPRTNVTMLGYGITNAECTGDNQVLIGNTAIGAAGIRAAVTGLTAYSDARFKTNVKDNVAGLNFILKLKPVTYNVHPKELHRIWGTPDSLVSKMNFSETEKETRIGFIAQDVEKAAKESGFNFPGIDVPRNDKEVYTLRYVDFIMPMVKAMQEQQKTINSQQSAITDLSGQVGRLQLENKKLKTEYDNRLKKMEELLRNKVEK